MKSKTSPKGGDVVGGSTSGSGLVIEVEPESSFAVGRRLAEARGRKTQEELAQELGVHKNTLARYERGDRIPDTDFVLAFCTKLRISPNWLLLGAEPKLLPDVIEQPMPPYAKHDLAKATPEDILSRFVLIPVYDVRAAAGYGGLVEDKEPIDWWAYSREWLDREVRVPYHRLAIIYIAGNSMEPDLHDGDPAMVDRGDTEVLREGVYVFSLDGHVFVKQISLDGARLVIESRNKDGHPTLELSRLREDISFRVAARVIGSPCFHRL
jgi:phage repressor protein C with HTH and peptisase S24 domain